MCVWNPQRRFPRIFSSRSTSKSFELLCSHLPKSFSSRIPSKTGQCIMSRRNASTFSVNRCHLARTVLGNVDESAFKVFRFSLLMAAVRCLKQHLLLWHPLRRRSRNGFLQTPQIRQVCLILRALPVALLLLETLTPTPSPKFRMAIRKGECSRFAVPVRRHVYPAIVRVRPCQKMRVVNAVFILVHKHKELRRILRLREALKHRLSFIGPPPPSPTHRVAAGAQS